MLSPELREKAESLVDRYPVGRSALLPLLHLVQAQDGYISDDGISECAQLLKLTKAEVAAVATFYSMYKREPLGRHLVSVCTNFACEVRGAGEVYARLRDRLGVGHNQTTEDGTITLEHAECLGNCDGAPVVTVDYFNYECLSPDDAEQLLDRVISGDVPLPTRGMRSPGIREVQHRLAGLGPVLPSQPGAEPGQAGGDVAAPPQEESGPGAPGASDVGEPAESVPAELGDEAGTGAERVSTLEPSSGEGSGEHDAESQRDPRTDDHTPDVAAGADDQERGGDA